ncbi:MAG: YciI family protein [Frankia sp.]
MFLIVLTYVKPLSEVDELVDAHLAHLDRYYDADVFVLSGRRVPRTGGVILAQGVSRATIETIAAEDPFVREGVATVEVIEFVPGTRSHPALAPLFSGLGGSFPAS